MAASAESGRKRNFAQRDASGSIMLGVRGGDGKWDSKEKKKKKVSPRHVIANQAKPCHFGVLLNGSSECVSKRNTNFEWWHNDSPQGGLGILRHGIRLVQNNNFVCFSLICAFLKGYQDMGVL